MNKSAAFMLGVEHAFEKEAFFGPFKKKKEVVRRAAGAFRGHTAELGEALAKKKSAKGIVRQKILDPGTGKYRIQRHIEL